MMSRADEPWVIAVDVGTSRTKACVVSAEGVLLTDPVVRPTSINPDELLDAVALLIDALPKQGVGMVVFSVYWHGLLMLDSHRQPMQQISTWEETWAAWAAEELRLVVDPEDYHRATGCFLHPSYPMVRLYADSDVSKDARYIGGPAEWLFLNFFSEFLTSRSMASATGLTDLHGEYDPAILDLLGISRGCLPVISASPAKGLAAPWRDRWPELADVPWHLAIGDGAAGAVGSGSWWKKRAALNLGTSSAVRVIVDQVAEVPKELFVYKVSHDGPWLVGGATSNSANLIRWAERNLLLPQDPVAVALSRAWDSHGLEVKPHFAGARSPWWAPRAFGRIDGIDMQTDSLDILQAMLEAATEDLVEVIRRLDAWVGEPYQLIASGGLVEDEASWAKLIQTRISRPLFKASSVHAGLRGAAMVALAESGVNFDEPDAAPVFNDSLPGS